jgi:uncharacterized protein YbcC (UPF0753/DUF2309 family)
MNMMSPVTAAETHLTRTEVASLVALAARTVAPIWPLESAIAVNPLSGFEDQPFDDAIAVAGGKFKARHSLPLALWRRLLQKGHIDERALRDAAIQHLGGIYVALAPAGADGTALDLLMARLLSLPPGAPARSDPDTPATAFVAKWCAAFFDGGVASSPMPHRELGLYRAVLALAAYDPDFLEIAGNEGQQLLLTVPRDPLAAIAEGLAEMGMSQGELDYLTDLVARLPGWAGHIRWRTEQADPQLTAAAPATMADLLALWLLLDRAQALGGHGLGLRPGECPTAVTSTGDPQEQARSATSGGQTRAAAIAALSEDALGRIFLSACEWTYQNRLMPELQASARQSCPGEAPAAQLVFCIDVRSEPFRRAIESEGAYETLGYAGFFGLPIALHRVGDERRRRFLPVLLAPQHDVSEAPVPGREDDAAKLILATERARQAASLFDLGKQGSATAFATAEATGPLAGLAMALRTLAPRVVDRCAAALKPARSQVLAPALDHAGVRPTFTLAEKVGYAAALFRLTGLAPTTARLVLLVGHGGQAINNPYAAALDCGACGGHAGGSNARLLAAMLNDPDVRAGLADQDLSLPETTIFIAAEHNTTTDEVRVFDAALVPPSHRQELDLLIASLARAGEKNRQRRAVLLGSSADDLFCGAVHWGEVRPEWGLAGNASFIAAPRWLTREVELEGRAFLHSYEWEKDPDGAVLTTILTAPMVVAQWINCQYLFSTIDNDRYGSGDKVTQNVIGRIGVVQGNGGDLKVGLPRQSLFADDGTPYHVPRRLLTVIHAPFDRVARIVEDNDILARLFNNGWVRLIVIEPHTGKALRWRAEGEPSAKGGFPLSVTL